MSDEQQHRLALPQGTRIRDFEFHRVLGYGGFGITYLGWNIALDIPVAIKEYLPADLATREQDLSVVPQASQASSDFQWGLERFLDEARILARFQHPNIVRVHHFFEAHSTAYIAMDYVEGEDLSAYLTRKGTLSESELKAILYPLLSALEVVHGADFLHRDIKPGNIVLRDVDGSPVLLDFGAARQAIGAKSRSVTSIVTPGYAPIEQYSSRGRQGPWTDIYALGGVCYRALTGQVPDDATDRVRNDPLIPVAQRCVGRASQEFLSAIDVALSVDEGDRPQSVGAWREALSEVQEAEGDEPTAVPRRGTEEIQGIETAEVSDVSRGRHDVLPSDTKKKEAVEHNPASAMRVSAIFGGVILFAILAGVYNANNERAALEKQRQEEQAIIKEAGVYSLHDAAQKNASEGAEVLIRHGADVNVQNAYGVMPLHGAAKKNATTTAEVLIRHGADVNAKGNDGVTPMHYAVWKDAAETAEVLIRHGADVNTKDENGMTPMHYAAFYDAAETVKVLLKHGADIQAKNNKGETPLNYAAFYDAAETAKVLRRYGGREQAALENQRQEQATSDDKHGVTPLHKAAANNRYKTAEVLLNNGADVNAKNKYGWTPLHLAALNNASATAEVLLKQGADVNAKDKYGFTPLHDAAEKDASATAEVLLEQGADVNAKDNDGFTPLHRAEQNNAAETAKLLLRYGANR